MALLYRHIRLDKNEVFYVGIAKHKTRPYSKKRNSIWKSIVAKTEYEIQIVFDDLTWEQAQKKEQEFIKLYGRIDLKTGTLANLTDGGDFSPNMSSASIEKIKQARAEQIFPSDWGKKISQKLKGRISPNKGKIYTNEEKEKISKTLKGRIFTDEHRKRLSQAMKGNKNGIQNLKQFQNK